jgi:hypothetical protein
MKFFKHSNGQEKIYPEYVKKGYEYVIRPDFTSFWRKIK